jgi:hypothetical protein
MQQTRPTYPPRGFGESPATATHWMLPTGRSWQSIASGYVALFAIVIWPLGPVALALGIWALVRASRQGSHGRGRSIFAIIVGLLTTAILIAVLTTL